MKQIIGLENTSVLSQYGAHQYLKEGQGMKLHALFAGLLFAGGAQAQTDLPITEWTNQTTGENGVVGYAAQPVICRNGTTRSYSLTVQCFGPNISVKLTNACDAPHRMFVVPARRDERSRMPKEVEKLDFETLMSSLTLLVSTSSDGGIPQSVMFDLRDFPLAMYADRSQCQL